MAPSTLDAIRWRYRRFVIDRDRLDDWHNFVLQRLRIMVDADGPVPTGHDARLSDGSPAAFTVDEDPSPYSKRRRPDKKVSTKTRRGVGRVPGQGQRTRRGSAARGAPETRQELLEHLSRYWADVRGVAAPFQDDEDTLLRIARAHRAKVDHPDDPAVWPEWLGLLAELQTTGRGY